MWWPLYNWYNLYFQSIVCIVCLSIPLVWYFTKEQSRDIQMTQDTIQGNLNENNNNKALLQFHWVNHNLIGNHILFSPQELFFRAIPYLLCFIQTVWIFFMKTTKTDFVGTVPQYLVVTKNNCQCSIQSRWTETTVDTLICSFKLTTPIITSLFHWWLFCLNIFLEWFTIDIVFRLTAETTTTTELSTNCTQILTSADWLTDNALVWFGLCCVYLVWGFLN